jgi:hypothetical protein
MASLRQARIQEKRASVIVSRIASFSSGQDRMFRRVWNASYRLDPSTQHMLPF